MKKKILVIIMLLVLVSLGVLAEEYDVRQLRWGMSTEKIIEIEGEPVYINAEDNNMLYHETINNLNFNTILYFNKKGLYQLGYVYSGDKSERTLLESYNIIQSNLIKKYGEPKEDNEIWYSDIYKDEPLKKHYALAFEHLFLNTIWDMDRTKIALGLQKKDGTIIFGILYQSKVIENIEDNSEAMSKL